MISSTPTSGSTLISSIIGDPYDVTINLILPENHQVSGTVNSQNLPPGLSLVYQDQNNILSISGTPNGVADIHIVTITVPIINNDTQVVTNEDLQFTIQIYVNNGIDNRAEILMADGTTKEVRYLKRGDWVAGNPQNTIQYRIARLIPLNYPSNFIDDFCRFGINSLAQDSPYKDLIIADMHPIIYGTERKRSVYFKDFTNVSHLVQVVARDILLIDQRGNYSTWNIQFETVGSFVANGMIIQSRHPRSIISPLPQYLYFDQTLYTPEIKNDFDPAYQYPLII